MAVHRCSATLISVTEIKLDFAFADSSRLRHNIRARRNRRSATMTEPAQKRSAKEVFEAEADYWEGTGEIAKPRRYIMGVAVLRCWMSSKGAEADKVSDSLRRYYRSVARAQAKTEPNWWNDLLAERDHCQVCGETFRIENLSFCTHCQSLFGYCHALTAGRLANGNYACPICPGGEIVG
jgi:hypothetical protein